MIEQGFFKSNFVGRDGFVWWIGQVAPKDTWKNNQSGFLKDSQSKIASAAKNNGYGERYRVRIMGYHTASKNDLPDDELPFASLMYPVTAGGGNNGASQSSNITEGTFVFGFFLDGEDAQQPVIMGCIGYNEYTKVMEGVPNIGFIPFTGKEPSAGGSRLTAETTQTQSLDHDTDAVSDTNANTPASSVDNSVEGSKQTNTEQNKQQVAEVAALKGAIPDANGTLPMSGMQLEISKAIQSIEVLKRSINALGQEQSDRLEDLQSQINNYIDKVSEFIASGIKWVYEMIEKQVMDKITKGFQAVYAVSLPNEMNTAKKVSNTVLDTISCFFRKLFGQLLNMIKNFVKDAVDRVVNVPVCFVETFVGKILGTLSGVISDALGGIGDLVSGAVDLAGEGLDIATDVLSLVADILSFLQCDDEPDLNEINQWSIVSGSGAISATDFTSIFDKAKNFAQKPQQLGLQALDNFNSIAETDFSDVFTNDCNTDEVACGPPTLEFFGSKDGSGAAGNLVIGTAGEVIGVDMKSFGIGYDNNTRARVVDGCGKGRGAVIRPVYGQIRPGNNTRSNRNSGTPIGTPDNIGFGPFADSNVPFYPFSADIPGSSIAATPFSPRMQAYGTPSYGLGPSFSRINQRTDGNQLSVRGGDDLIEFVIEEFFIQDGTNSRAEFPRIAFAIKDTSISDRYNTNFDYTPDDTTFKPVQKGPESTIPTFSDTTIIFPLNYTNLNSSNNSIRVTNNGRKIRLKDSDGDDTNAAINIENVEGGIARFTDDGRGIEVTGNVRARINLDVIDNPNTNGISLDSVEINGVTFNRIGSQGEPAKIVTFDATKNVNNTTTIETVPIDTSALTVSQRQKVVPDEKYDVRGFIALTGDPLQRPLIVTDNGKTVRADGETIKIRIEKKEIEVKDEAEEVPLSFQGLHKKNTNETIFEEGNKNLVFRDGDGDDANSELEIESGNAVFAINENGIIVLRGVGSINLRFKYDDDPDDSGTALDGVAIKNLFLGKKQKPGSTFKDAREAYNAGDISGLSEFSKDIITQTQWRYDESVLTAPKLYEIAVGAFSGENRWQVDADDDEQGFVPLGEPGGGDEKGKASGTVNLSPQTRVIVTEEKINEPELGDNDYDDLVITAKIGKFKQRKNGSIFYILKDDDDDDDDFVGIGTDVPISIEITPTPGPLTPTPPGPGEIIFPSGGGDGGEIPGILSPGPGSNHTFHPHPGTTTLGPGVWVPGPVPSGGGGPHVGPAVFIHDGKFIGDLIGQTGSPLSSTNIGSFDPGSGGAGGPGIPGSFDPGTPPGSFDPGPGPGGFGPGPGTPPGSIGPGPGPGGFDPGPGTPPGSIGPGPGPGGFDPGPGTPPGGFGPGPGPGPGPGGFGPGPGPGPGGFGPTPPGGGGGPGPSDPGGLTPNIGGPLTPGPGYWNPFPGPYPGDPGATGVLVPHDFGGTSGPGIGIVDIIIEEPGTGYLSGPDGSHGGDGRTYADKCDVRVTRIDGRKELPYSVGTTVCVNEGDTVILPPGTSTITEPFDSEGGGENILGGSPHVMINAGCFTVTECPDAPKSESTYPVLLYLCDVIIRSPGSGYKSTDTISINPDLGAKAQLVVDKFGRITDVVVTEGGQGYQVMPTITIITTTGRNAVLLPKLCIDRVDDDEILDQEKVISVVDCVGKF